MKHQSSPLCLYHDILITIYIYILKQTTLNESKILEQTSYNKDMIWES